MKAILAVEEKAASKPLAGAELFRKRTHREELESFCEGNNNASEVAPTGSSNASYAQPFGETGSNKGTNLAETFCCEKRNDPRQLSSRIIS